MEFEKFTAAWNAHMMNIHQKVEQQKNSLCAQQAAQMRDLEAYLEKTLVAGVRPTSDILNL